jgi:serine/threonine-protein kinase
VLALFGIVGLAPLRADEAASQLAQQALELRTRYCGDCHGAGGMAKADFDFVLSSRQLVAAKMIVPRDPEASAMLTRIREGSMPPEGVRQRPTPEEIRTLEKWIEAGAPAAETEKHVRTFRTERDVLVAIRRHLEQTNEEDRRFQRYFSLVNLYNSRDVSGRDLRLYRAAIGKLLGSFGPAGDAVVPQALDAEGTILAINLRRLGLDRDDGWRKLLQFYPYGMRPTGSRNADVRGVAEQIEKLGDPECALLYVRADWFVATASQLPVLPGRLAPLAESLTPLVHRYQRELGLDDIACELGLPDGATFRKLLPANHPLQKGALKAVLDGASLSRQEWDSRDKRTKTLYQEVAAMLGLGTPYHP